jgi:hypothetical protein
MMGCANQADAMSLHEYEERLWHWNEAHDTEGRGLPDIDVTMALIDKINADPKLTH